jgi:hypothetical protein
MSEQPISTDPQVHLRHNLNELLEEKSRLDRQLPSLIASVEYVKERQATLNAAIAKLRPLIRQEPPEPFVTHYWGRRAMSPCGREVASAYSINGHGYSTEWADVDCPACLNNRPT